MPQNPDAVSTVERIVIAAAVMGVVCAVCLWLMLEHDDEVRKLFRKALGKADSWVQ